MFLLRQSVNDECNSNNNQPLVQAARKARNTLQVSWVKAHARIVGNELADHAAKAATGQTLL